MEGGIRKVGDGGERHAKVDGLKIGMMGERARPTPRPAWACFVHEGEPSAP